MADRSFVGKGLPFSRQSQRPSVHHLTQPFELSYKVNVVKSHGLYRKRLMHRRGNRTRSGWNTKQEDDEADITHRWVPCILVPLVKPHHGEVSVCWDGGRGPNERASHSAKTGLDSTKTAAPPEIQELGRHCTVLNG